MENCTGLADIETSSTGENACGGRIVAPNEALSPPSAIAVLGNCATFLDFQVESVSRENLENAASSSPGCPCSSLCRDLFIVSYCSGNQSNEFLKDSFDEFLDPERKSSENLNNNLTKFRKENTPTSELRPARKLLQTDCRRSFPSVKMPSKAEIEDYFTEAEKLEQKQFSEKYNFDFVKSIPLEGRYEWIPLKP